MRVGSWLGLRWIQQAAIGGRTEVCGPCCAHLSRSPAPARAGLLNAHGMSHSERRAKAVAEGKTGLPAGLRFPGGYPPPLREVRRAIAQLLPAEHCRYGITDFTTLCAPTALHPNCRVADKRPRASTHPISQADFKTTGEGVWGLRVWRPQGVD